MTDFTREQLEEIVAQYWTGRDLATYALALLDQNEALRRDKIQLGEERAAEWKRAEKAEAERDEANDERDDAVDRWARRAREAEATCKELLQVQAERDRLNDLLRRIEGLDEKADAISWEQQAEDRGNLALQIAAERDRLRAELLEAEEAIRILTSLPQAKPITGEAVECVACGQRKAPIGRDAPSMLYLCDQECPGYKDDPRPGFLWPGETLEDFGYPQEAATADGKLRVALQHPAVRRARERAK